MGEARRRARHAIECREVRIPRDSTTLEDCAARVLHHVAEILQSGIFLKEVGDDLANFPIWSLVCGGFSSADAARATCPLVTDIRHIPGLGWQFRIPDRFFLGLYFADMMVRGRPPVSPATFMEAVRRYLARPGGGWVAVGPMTATKPDGRVN